MISLRKLAFSFLAPIGALTIIGTGFATWTFSTGEVHIEEKIQDNVNVTAEVKNGDLEVLSVPDMLVFSEGTQGKHDLFDGIDFYTKKEISEGTNFKVTINNGTSHKLSFVYDNLGNPPCVYFSWSDSDSYATANIISGTLKSSAATPGNYFGTWTGSGTNKNNENYTISLTLDTDYSGQISITDKNKTETIDTFAFKITDSEIFPNITVTDSTFSFRYYYANPDLVNETATRYALNVEMGLFLDSNDPFEFNTTKEAGGYSLIGKPANESSKSITSFVLSNNSGIYDLELSINIADEPTTKINYKGLTFTSDGTGGDSVFPNGSYSGFSISKIPCTLNLKSDNSSGAQVFTSTLEIGSMNHYLSLIDEFTDRTDGEGYFNIMSEANKDAIDTVLHISIDRSHLSEKKPYLDFTCQLANYLRYKSSDVKPTSPDKYLGLRIASLLGGWKFRISINAFFTPI